ncbi:MAG: hypothetical protein H7270_12685 [Dermatophilaceae bacterium]|nr:hypothetical protein [Dermatophilaceae bacterium]
METKNGVDTPGRAPIAQPHLRTDNWRKAPLWTFIGLTAFVVYATIRVFTQSAYFVEGANFHYLSPFASPCLSDSCGAAAEFGTWGTFPQLIPLAILTLPFILLFRLTCYYYRKAYYRAFWMSPAACAVPEPRAKYSGETRFPLIMQNAHRYFFFIVVGVSAINTFDAVKSFHGTEGFGLGLGNIIIVVNVILLWSYTLGCHSCRHITAGRINHFSKHPVRYWLYQKASKLNGKHMQLAWITLGTLVLTDAYIALISLHPNFDLRFIG